MNAEILHEIFQFVFSVGIAGTVILSSVYTGMLIERLKSREDVVFNPKPKKKRRNK